MLCEDVAMFSDLLFDDVDLLTLFIGGYHLVDHVLVDCANSLESENCLSCQYVLLLLRHLLKLLAPNFDVLDESLAGLAARVLNNNR